MDRLPALAALLLLAAPARPARAGLSNAFDQASAAASQAARKVDGKAPADADHHWLPDLQGLPQPPSEPPVADEVRQAAGGAEAGCSALNPGLRAMVFRHFQNFQALENAQGVYLDAAAAERWAHVLAMILKESSGDPTDVTDMRGRESGTYRPMTSLARWKALFDHGNLAYNRQTNYGLAQLSYDRLSTPLGAPETPALGFIGGGPDAASLDTAHAARRLLWVYQDFAQGRVSPGDARIPAADRSKPEFAARAR
ncbi:MAG: hypothetical protein KGL53_04560, partial [Elusimicrobia bacterium]|nr:hypothetical protein [Elusimicrobiota bacterium]